MEPLEEPPAAPLYDWPPLTVEAAPGLPPEYVGPAPLPNSRPAFSCEVSDHPWLASRASASGAGCNVVALDVSVLFVVVEPEDCAVLPTPGFLLAKAPPLEMDSPARESDVMVPAPSVTGLLLAGSVVTWILLVKDHWVSRDIMNHAGSRYSPFDRVRQTYLCYRI